MREEHRRWIVLPGVYPIQRILLRPTLRGGWDIFPNDYPATSSWSYLHPNAYTCQQWQRYNWSLFFLCDFYRLLNIHRVISFKTWRFLLSLLLGLLLVVSGAASTIVQIRLPATSCIGATCQHFDYIVTILMENNGYCDVVTTCGGSGTYETSLAQSYAVAGKCNNDTFCSGSGYTALFHPSEPNYIALLGGSNFGITEDNICCYTINQANLIDGLQTKSITWDAYAEDATGSGTCKFLPPSSPNHFGFLEFKDNNVTSRCAHFLTTTSPTLPSGPVNDHEFLAELNSSSPSHYIWLTPNYSDDGHDTGVTGADAYLSNLVPKILNSNLFATHRAALFIVYDEGPTAYIFPDDFVYASWSGPAVKQHHTGTGSYSHYSYLSTLENNWGFTCLVASNDCSAPPMTEFFVS
jgi:phosphoesterase family protein